MELSQTLQQPHVEVNETGVRYEHPGYKVVKCTKCNQDCLSAVGAPVVVCGQHDGGHKV